MKTGTSGNAIETPPLSSCVPSSSTSLLMVNVSATSSYPRSYCPIPFPLPTLWLSCGFHIKLLSKPFQNTIRLGMSHTHTHTVAVRTCSTPFLCSLMFMYALQYIVPYCRPIPPVVDDVLLLLCGGHRRNWPSGTKSQNTANSSSKTSACCAVTRQRSLSRT